MRNIFPSSWPARLLLIAACAALAAATLYHDSRYGVIAPENRPIKSLVDGYVSSDSCRACHESNYTSWHASFHRTMTQVATPGTLLPDLDGLLLTLDGREYKGERSGGKFFIRKKPAGGELGRPQEVVLVTGSHNLQVPWLETGEGRTLEQLPFAYIIREKMWAPVNQTFLMPPELKGLLRGRCSEWRLHGLPRHPGTLAICAGE